MAKQKKGKHAAPDQADSAAQQTEVINDSPSTFSGQQTSVMPAVQSSPYGQEGVSEYGMINSFDDFKAKKKKPKGKIAAVVLGVIAIVLLVIYLAGAFYFSGHFFPGTTMGDRSVSLQTRADMAEYLNKEESSFALAVSGDGVSFNISSTEAGISINGDTVAMQALNKQNIWAWPVAVFGTHDVSSALTASYNQSGLEPIVRQKVDEFNATAVDPVNATISYSEVSKAFVIAPEQAGTKLDFASVIETIDNAILHFESTVKLDATNLIQPTVLKGDQRLKTASDSANAFIKADLTLVLGEEAVPAGEINADQISQWITLSPDLNVTFNEDAMNEWVETLAADMDTVGSTRTYTRPDGKVITVSGGTYGWEIDSESFINQVKEGITQGQVGTLTIATITEGVSYEPGGKDWGAYADVDLSEQHARFFDTAGNLLWESDVVTGIPDAKHATPEGVWVCFNKESPSILKGDIQQSTGQPEYETRVQYWMPFTYSGCGFHDATWQSAFGGSRYADGYGSHGCVNLPYDAAAALYDTISVGNAVIIHW